MTPEYLPRTSCEYSFQRFEAAGSYGFCRCFACQRPGDNRLRDTRACYGMSKPCSVTREEDVSLHDPLPNAGNGNGTSGSGEPPGTDDVEGPEPFQ